MRKKPLEERVQSKRAGLQGVRLGKLNVEQEETINDDSPIKEALVVLFEDSSLQIDC